MKLLFAADHGGFKLKELLKEYAQSLGYEIQDFGAKNLDPLDDYPDYVNPLAQAISQDPNNLKGVVICRNGVGVSVAANKFAHVRAGLSWTKDHALTSRKDDNTNILALPADYINQETAKEILKTWLETAFSPEEKYLRRINKIW